MLASIQFLGGIALARLSPWGGGHHDATQRNATQRNGWAAASFALIVGFLAGCQDSRSDESGADLVDSGSAGALLVRAAHGSFETADGEWVDPGLPEIRRTQAHLIETLEAANGAEAEKRGLIFRTLDDSVVASALYIDELLRKAGHPARASDLNASLRNHYLFQLRGERPKPSAARFRGIPHDLVAILEAGDIEVRTTITSNGAGYIQDCRDAGVPVPNSIFNLDDGWVRRGNLDFSFINAGYDENENLRENEIWSWESDSPDGICIALPRWDPNDTSPVLGFICLGRTNGKVCYFDNEEGVPTQRNQTYGIDFLVGGTTLQGNGGGICTDCHAGGNPFVVHPDQELAFVDLVESRAMVSAVWPDPLVVGTWPQNPGPIMSLGPVPEGQSRCDGCHNGGTAGRFPLFSEPILDPLAPSSNHGGYCNAILDQAVNGTAQGDPPTMPPKLANGNPDMGDYSDHIAYLTSLCGSSGPPGAPVGTPGPLDDPSFLSNPTVHPLYACGGKIAVSGFRRGATVSIYRNLSTTPEATAVGQNPNVLEFTLADPLEEGDTWTATQMVGGVESPPATPVEVRNYLEVYPNGLPAPQIQPFLTHECGRSIAVSHVPGAILEVTRAGNPTTVTSGSGIGYTRAFADAEFSVGDQIVVQQFLCGDASDPSDPALVADPEPVPMPPLSLEPEAFYEGQELVTIRNVEAGAEHSLTSSLGPVSTIGSWPFLIHSNHDIAAVLGRPIQVGESFELKQWLCESESTVVSSNALPCSSLPAPEIVPPLAGEEIIRMSRAVPGAIIRVWSTTEEIGDGGGDVINVRPLVAGETIRVMQSLGSCHAQQHFSIEVRP
ncbi:MAG: hypothetical protein AAGF12_19880 [Myxococcota bacterium]